MPTNSDWIRQMIDRGLLTPEQAEHAASAEAESPSSAGAPPLTPPATLPTLPPDAPFLLSCAPCGTVFPAPGVDPARLPACPVCGGMTRLVTLGARVTGPMTPPAAPPPEGKPFGRYLLRRQLGRGGMGVVYEAFDKQTGRAVALKMLLAPGHELDEGAVERLMREARSAAKLRHPGIVAVHEIGSADGRHFFTMELVEGPSLEERLAEPGWRSFPVRKRLEALAQVADALAFAHGRGVVHRDVKPANVLLAGGAQAKLTDFGLAKEFAGLDGGGLTLSGVVLGTPHYMSPEQAAGRVRQIGPASDIFSFGVMLYRAASNRLPFSGGGVEALHRTLHDDPPPPARRGGLPPGVAAVCLRCLEKDPKARYADGGALAAEMKRILAGQPVEAKMPRRPARRAKPAAPAVPQATVDARAHAEALRLLELGRPSLDRAFQARYERDVDEEALAARLLAARRQFEDASLLAPDLPLGPYLVGLAHELEGDMPAAERRFRDALRLDPDFGPAHYWLGRVLIVRAYATGMSWGGESAEQVRVRREGIQSLSEEAGRCFDAALARGSGFEDALQKKVAEALSARGRSDPAAVRRICEEGLAAFPRSPGREDLHWVRGMIEEGEASLAELNRAIEIRPRFALALYSRSRTNRDLKDLPAVLEDLRRVTRLWPKFLTGWISLGWVSTTLERYEDGLECGTRALALDPHCAMAYLNRSVARFRMGDSEGAIADCARSLELDPASPLVYGNRAQALVQLGRHAEAVPDFREAIRRQPKSPGHRNDLGITLMVLGETAEAERVLTETVTLFPEHITAWNNRGVVRLELRNPRGAIADLDQALKLRPGYPEAFHNRAEALLQLGDAAGAERDAAEAIRLRPAYANAWKRRGIARHRLGRLAEARADLDECLRLAPADAQAFVARGDVRAAMGEPEAAREDWRRVLELPKAEASMRAEATRRLQ
ncbi:MAG: protein kinase [Planctomycetes bacterium]|nr:protein kinase [Planctomycetota bacterium]